MAKLWEEKKINLVERPEWSEFDVAGDLADVVFQNMADSVSYLGPDDIGDYANLVMDHGRKKRVFLDHDQDRAIYKAYEDQDPRVETFRYIIIDSSSWAWDKAFTPTKSDVAYAMDEAIEAMTHEARGWLSGYDGLWDSLEYMKKTPAVFIRELLQNYVDLEQEEGHYDRYMIFNPNTPYIENVSSGTLTPSSKRGVLDWEPNPEVPKEEMAAEVKSLLKDMEEPFIERTFRILKKSWQDKDFGNRYEFRKTMDQLMKDDPKRVRAARKELVELLKTKEKETEEGQEDA